MSLDGVLVLDRRVARLRGDDPIRFLQDTTSEDVLALPPGTGALTCLLDETGRVLSEFRVIPLPDGSVLLDGEPAAGEAMLGWLARVAPLSGCRLEDETEAWVVTAIRGDAAEPLGEHAVRHDDGVVRVGVVWGGAGVDVLAPAAVEGAPLAHEDYERARIADGRPRYGIDVTAETHITETPLVWAALSRTKGCYPGQESVARVLNLGRARRALVIVEGDGVSAGAGIESDGRAVGRVTSAVGGAGLAMVRSEVAEGVAVSVGGAPATVRPIPPRR